MLANIRVIVATFCTIYIFLTISEVTAPKPDVGYFMSHSGKICKSSLTADALNTICRALAQTYKKETIYPDESNIKGDCKDMYFDVSHPQGDAKAKCNALVCNLGPGVHRCVTTTDASGTYHSWDTVEMSVKITRVYHKVVGCSYLDSFQG